MGSAPTELDGVRDEDQVEVELTAGFWLGQTEVTQKQWQDVMGTTPWLERKFSKVQVAGFYPASYCTWDSSMEFCRKLTEQEQASGRITRDWRFDLPTEAQWEYACRAGTTGPYNGDGTGVLSDYAWYSRNTLPSAQEFVRGANYESYGHQVGVKRPNQWGLFDMHGNVLEWCRDDSVDELPGGQDPLSLDNPSGRACRGGYYSSDAVDCRSGSRTGRPPFMEDLSIGFRVALVPATEKVRP